MQSRFASLIVISLSAACTSPSRSGRLVERPEPTYVSLVSADPVENATVGAPTASGTTNLLTAKFKGKDRRVAKTSLADVDTIENFKNVDDLLDALQPDEDMLEHSPPLLKDSTFDRVEEEERNVRVHGWIYAFRLEDDMDFHVIVGTDPTQAQRQFLNCEVSGLPSTKSVDYKALKQARKDFSDLLDGKLPGTKYELLKEPIPVIVTGSLFYDIDHAPGVVGPAKARPTTAWEIHPVSEITRDQ